jgi:hypothetical protein
VALLKKIAVISIAACLALVAAGYVAYLANTAPVAAPISTAEASNPSKPFLVLDFTDDQTTDASRAAAERVGLGRIFEESGSTGVVLIVDGPTKEVTASIAGSRDLADYRASIDAALNRTRSR